MSEAEEMQIHQQNIQSNESTLQFQILVDDELREFEHNIKKEIKVWNKEKYCYEWIRPEGLVPVMNDKGINSMMMIMRPSLSKIFILGNLQEETAEKMALSSSIAIINMIEENWEAYEVSSPSEASAVVEIAENTIISTMTKGTKAKYLGFLRTIQSYSEHQNLAAGGGGGMQQERRSWLSKLFSTKS